MEPPVCKIQLVQQQHFISSERAKQRGGYAGAQAHETETETERYEAEDGKEKLEDGNVEAWRPVMTTKARRDTLTRGLREHFVQDSTEAVGNIKTNGCRLFGRWSSI